MTQDIRRAIAARLRALILGPNKGDLAAAARRLGVDERSLRMSIDEAVPYPTLEVIAAVVAHYEVDPSFLLTGEYDPATHRMVLEGPRDQATQTVLDVIRSRLPQTNISHPTPDSPMRRLT